MDRAPAGSMRGRVAELLVAADLTARGYIVSMTSPEACYDLVAERPRDHTLFRIQVKAAYQKGQRLIFSTSRARPRHAPRLLYGPNDFDCFAVVTPEGLIFYADHDENTPISSRTVSEDMGTEPGT